MVVSNHSTIACVTVGRAGAPPATMMRWLFVCVWCGVCVDFILQRDRKPFISFFEPSSIHQKVKTDGADEGTLVLGQKEGDPHTWYVPTPLQLQQKVHYKVSPPDIQMKPEIKYGLYISIGFVTLITLEVAYNYYKSTLHRPSSLNHSTDPPHSTDPLHPSEAKRD